MPSLFHPPNAVKILTATLLLCFTCCSGRAQEPDFGSAPFGTWHYILYTGKMASYRLPMPSYWQEAKSPLDSNADRSFSGPGGLVLSVYVIDKKNPNSFWAALRQSARIIQIKPVSPGKNAHTSQLFVITSAPVSGSQIHFVSVERFNNQTLAFTMTMPVEIVDPRQAVGLSACFEIGKVTGSMKRLEKGDKIDFHEEHRIATIPLVVDLAEAVRAPGATGPHTPGAVLLTKAQWKARMASRFRWYPGTPVIGQAAQFQQIMGKPDRTQTVGEQAYWYYQCADGTIQLSMNVLNLQAAGFLQADVNDY